MKTAILAWIVAAFFFAFVSSEDCRAESTEDEVRTADRLFNLGHTGEAMEIYQRCREALEGAEPGSPLLSEIINNIASVYMAEGRMEEFRRHFLLARSLKQDLAGRMTVRKQMGRLLVNGGFEEGLIFPWGTGHYERPEGRFRFGVWWNSMNAKAFMKIDAAEKHSGSRSLRITNYSPVAPHVFTTLSQRIEGLTPNTIYRFSYFAKAQDLARGAVSFAVDAAWTKRLPALPGGTYDWRAFSNTINIGHNDTIDFRIIHLNTGTVWLDDIVVEQVGASEAPEPLQRVERLIDLAQYDEALKLCLELEETHGESPSVLLHVRFQMGRIHQVIGKYEKALEEYNYVISKGLKRANIDLAHLFYQLGDYEMARDTFLKAYEIVKGDQGTESLVLNELSRCYLGLSRLEKALNTQRKSYHILKHIDDRHGQALSLNQLGEIHERMNDPEGARGAFQEGLKLARQLADRKLESDILLNLAQTAFRHKDMPGASGYAREALAIKQSIHEFLGIVRALHMRGRLAVAGKRHQEARESYLKAVLLLDEISTTVSDISRETKATFLHQFNELYREYVELLLRMSRQTGSSRYQQEAFPVVEQARSRVFTEMMQESRALRSFAAGSSSEFGRLLEEERLLAIKVHALKREKQRAEEGGDLAGIKAAAELIESNTAQHRALQDRLEKEYPRYADIKNPKPLGLKDVQKILLADEAVLSYFVTPGCTGLWCVTRERAQFVFISLSRDELINKTEHYRLSFADMAHAISRGIRVSPGDKDFPSVFSGYHADEAYELYGILVKAVESLLANKEYVFLALDDLLYKLPFETLLTEPFAEDRRDGEVPGDSLAHAPFWVKTHCFSYLPSLSVLRSLRTIGKEKPSGQEPLLAFADPLFRSPAEGKSATQQGFSEVRSLLLRELHSRSILKDLDLPPLPDTRQEALEVAALLGASVERDVYLQGRATEFNLKRLQLNGYQNLLFATHGLLAGDFGPGTQPGLLLSFINDPENDGLLEMGEILGLDLNADLAVLSACNTASGTGGEDRGEGFAGLTRSFMYAGARSLLVTQWSVESRSARMLVQATFSRIKDGVPKTKALALAKRELIERGSQLAFGPYLRTFLSHPFFWAPYVLVGESR